MVRFQTRSIFTLFLIVVFAYILFEVSDRPTQVKMFPIVISVIALALLTVQLIRELVPSAKKDEASIADIDFTEEESTAAGKRRALEMFAWLFGFVVFLWLVGFNIAVPVMIFLFLLRHREGLAVTILLPLGAFLVTWGGFDQLLNLPFPPGMIFEWLGWT